MGIRRRIFCDTNILLDFFDAERAYHRDAVALLWYAADNPGDVDLPAPITSFKDAYYILTRLYRSEPQARESIASVMGAYVQPVDMLADYGVEALAADEPDFEDALVGVSAVREGASAIITRDEAAFAHFGIPKFTAGEFLDHVGFNYEEVDI